MKWPVQTALHLSVTTALALVVVGATSNGKDIALEKVGYIVFLGIWILISVFAFLSLKQDHSNALAQKVCFFFFHSPRLQASFFFHMYSAHMLDIEK